MDQSVSRAAIFQRLEPSVVDAVSERLLPADYRPGKMIFAEGQPGDRLYIIASGKVKIARRARWPRQSSSGPWSVGHFR
jgi:CRP/FNR family cyclic AMP-dependent transcriptional regulator